MSAVCDDQQAYDELESIVEVLVKIWRANQRKVNGPVLIISWNGQRPTACDGCLTVAAAAADVKRLHVCDRVFSYSYENASGGFYAEYVSLGRKTSLALVRFAASIALRMMRGHNWRHTLRSYFSPATRNAKREPATALTVSSRIERSAATVSLAPGSSFGSL
jgi:hypothetical protein